MLSSVQCVLHISGVHINIRVGTERIIMRLVVLAALVAVCGAAKLDRSYLPPASSQTAGGLPGDLQTPFARSSQNSPSNQVQGNQGLGGLPNGAYNNAFGDVVVDASAAGTRAAGPGESGLGGPRASYGSQASKVGDAAFRQSQTAGFRNGFDNFQVNAEAETAQGFVPQQAQPERQQAAADRAANTVRFDSEVGPESFNYAFETDNGIAAEESGVATNGVQAQGAFSYTSDDGKSYSVTYTADENGYQPKGDHLPTPPPIPEEILKSLEKNAQDEAAGLIDDGSYDASKYNEGSDYNESDNGQYNRGQSSVGSGNGASSDIGAASFVSQSTFAQQSADAGNNENANFEQSASNNAPGQFAQPAHGLSQGVQQGSFRQAAAQASFGHSQKLQAQGNFGYLPPGSEASSQASTGFRSQQLNQQPLSNQASAGFRTQQLNQPSRNQNPFANQRPSQSASASASFGPSQVNEPQPTSPSQYNSASAQTQQFQGVKIQPKFPSQGFNAQSSSKFSQVQASRPTQQAFGQPQFNSNQNAQGFAPTPTQSASAFASTNGQPNQFSNNNSPSFPNQKPQGQFQQNSQFNEKLVQQNLFNQPQFASSTQRPGFGFQNPDNSYYYNQPSQPFRTPTVEPQRNQPAQFDRLAQSYSANANAQFGAFPTQPSYSQRGSGSTRYPRPPTLTPAEPTVFVQPENQAFNGVTQATATSFAQGRPGQPRFPSQQPTQQSFSQSTQYPDTPSQQYNGELYDYSKPADSLTTPKDSNPQGSEQVDAEVAPTQNIQAFASAEYQGSSVPQEQGSNPDINQGYQEPQGQAGFSQPGFSQISAASVAGKGEVFGGPRQPPSFNEQTGYQY